MKEHEGQMFSLLFSLKSLLFQKLPRLNKNGVVPPSTVVPSVWSPNQQHQYRLRTCSKSDFVPLCKPVDPETQRARPIMEFYEVSPPTSTTSARDAEAPFFESPGKARM